MLESLQQYVQHEVAPPKSLPDMRTAYFAAIENGRQKEQRRIESKLDRVLAMWQNRVDWWNTEFKVPTDIKPKPAAENEAPRSAESRSTMRNSRRMERPLPYAEGVSQEAGAIAKAKRANASNAPQGIAVEAAQPMERDARKDTLRKQSMLVESKAAAPQAPAAEPPAQRQAISDKAGRNLEEAAALDHEKQAQISPSSSGSISIKEWDPSTPYLKRLREASPETYAKVYMELRKDYGDSPAFYLDCADFFFKQKQDAFAVRVLSNIAELELENPKLLRVLGYRLSQAHLMEPARMVFEEVLRLRPEEPQSYRDLAITLDEMEQYDRAVELLYQVVTMNWDRFPEIEVVALMELNRAIARAKRAGLTNFPVDPRLIKPLDLDVRIVLTWDADMTDLDLWMTEPSGQKAYYQNKLTSIGGLVSRDVTDGYGPEEYVLKKAMKGRYKAQANYYGSQAPSLTGAVTLQVDVFTNYGRADEKKRSITLRLKQRQEVVDIGDIDFQ